MTVAFYPFTATASSSSGTNPWQFKPETYGAKGNGKVYADGVVTSGSANFSSTNATFTSADVGKYIMINSAQGDNQPPVTTTISTVTDSHHIVVATPLSANRSNVSFAYGTDDTAAVQAAVNAAGAYALANNYFAEVLLGPHIGVGLIADEASIELLSGRLLACCNRFSDKRPWLVRSNVLCLRMS